MGCSVSFGQSRARVWQASPRRQACRVHVSQKEDLAPHFGTTWLKNTMADVQQSKQIQNPLDFIDVNMVKDRLTLPEEMPALPKDVSFPEVHFPQVNVDLPTFTFRAPSFPSFTEIFGNGNFPTDVGSSRSMQDVINAFHSSDSLDPHWGTVMLTAICQAALNEFLSLVSHMVQ